MNSIVPELTVSLAGKKEPHVALPHIVRAENNDPRLRQTVDEVRPKQSRGNRPPDHQSKVPGAHRAPSVLDSGKQTKKRNDPSRARIKFTDDRSYLDSSICGRFCFPDLFRELADLQPTRFVHRPRQLPVFLSEQLRRPTPVVHRRLGQPSTGPFEEIEQTSQDSQLPPVNQQANPIVRSVQVRKKPIVTGPLLPSLSQQRT